MIIQVENWPMRRRAMILLLDNPRLQRERLAGLYYRAMKLAELCEENYHPLCARIIRLRMYGIRTTMEELLEARRDKRPREEDNLLSNRW